MASLEATFRELIDAAHSAGRILSAVLDRLEEIEDAAAERKTNIGPAFQIVEANAYLAKRSKNPDTGEPRAKTDLVLADGNGEEHITVAIWSDAFKTGKAVADKLAA